MNCASVPSDRSATCRSSQGEITLSVIVPTYNERENIRPLIERTLAAMGGSGELIIVDDDSPDGTAESAVAVAESLGAAERVRVVVRKGERGLASAVTRGFREAKGRVLAVMDADLSHPPELLPRLLEPIMAGRADIAVASRRVHGGGSSGWPLRRRIVSWVAGLLARPLVPIRDTTSGYFAFRRDVLEGIELRPIGYKIGLEIFARARGARFEEVPFVFTDRASGKSKLGGAVMLAYLVQLAALYRERLPLLVGYIQFGLVGALGMAVDAAAFSLAYWYAGFSRLGPELGSFLAQTASFVVAASSNFALNRAWTFRERASNARWTIFLLISFIGYCVRSPVVWAFVRAGMPELAALLSGIFVASIWNFLGSRRWAFPAGQLVAEVTAQGEGPAEMRARAGFVVLLIGLTAFRLVYSALVCLASDEAYYWQWSRHLDWGYFDHPPMIAYLIAAGTRLAGHNELGVRLASVALSAAGLWMVYRLGCRFGKSARAGLWAAGAFAAAPIFAAGGMLATPDAPFVFFWTMTLLLTLKALDSAKLSDWAFAGVTLGCGMLSKYPMVVLPAGVIVALVLTRRGRDALKTPGPYVAAALGAAICVPLALWQIEMGFRPILFQLGHGLGPAAGGKPTRMPGLLSFLEFLGGQALVLSPVLFLLLVVVLVRSLARLVAEIRSRQEDCAPSLAIVIAPSVLTLGLFAAASFLARGEANWPAAAYPALFALLGAELANSAGRVKRALAWVAVGMAALGSAYIHLEAAYPLVRYTRGAFAKVYDRRPFANWAHGLRCSRGGEGLSAAICAESYQTASILSFYLPDKPETFAPLETGSGEQYGIWRKGLPEGKAAWYFTDDEPDPRVEVLLEGGGEFVGDFSETRLGAEIAVFRAYWGRLRPVQAQTR